MQFENTKKKFLKNKKMHAGRDAKQTIFFNGPYCCVRTRFN